MVDEIHERKLFYYLVTSERNPSKDPVVLWLNGGPGCSSMDGFVYEHGPFNFQKADKPGALPQLYLNPHSWSKVSNIIYLDSPTGVGFSYSNSKEDYRTGYLKTASDSHRFLLKWFEQYPEFFTNPFYLVGESFAGFYVPTLASEVAKGIKAGLKPILNFKGYMIGNAITDEVINGNALVPFAHGMGLISDDLYEETMKTCKGDYSSPYYGACGDLLLKINDDDRVVTEWLNNAAVREAIHAEQMSVIGAWALCVNIFYIHDAGSKIKYHKNLTTLGYRALIYSGDHDMCVPYTGSETWTRSLGYKIIDEWRPWYCNEQVAGYTQGYAKNLTFLTIKGAGHTVPEYKPIEALAFYSRWLEGHKI